MSENIFEESVMDASGKMISILMFVGILSGFVFNAPPMTRSIPTWSDMLGHTIAGVLMGVVIGLIMALGYTVLWNIYRLTLNFLDKKFKRSKGGG